MKKWIIFSCISFCFWQIAAAQAGSLDPAFGTGGKITRQSNTAFLQGSAIALQAGGKMLVAATEISTPVGPVLLTRYLPDGNLDTAFGQQGHLVFPNDTASEEAVDLAVLPDNKILLATTVWPWKTKTYAWQFRRFLPDGLPDVAFGENGLVRLSSQTDLYFITAIAIQPDGKILAAGQLDTACIVLRLNPDGSPDSTFGLYGAIYPGANSQLLAIGVQSDGKAVIALWGEQLLTLFRCLPDGSIDSTFGDAGRAMLPFAEGYNFGALNIASSDKIYIAGTINETWALTALEADGSPDLGFSPGGTQIYPADPSNLFYPYNLSVLPDGRVRLAGTRFNGQSVTDYSDFQVVQVLPDGNLDPNFGQNGVAVTDLGTSDDYCYNHSLAVLSDTAFLLLGAANYDLALVRYNASGQPDPNFGNGGALILVEPSLTENPSYDKVRAVLVQSDGKIVLGGYSYGLLVSYLLPKKPFVSRLLSDGALDSTFDQNNIQACRRLNSLTALVIQPGGQLLVGGAYRCIRLSPEGNPDTTFGEHGVLKSELYLSESAQALAIQADGKIALAGSVNIDGQYHFALSRYNPDGSPDLSFGLNGMITYGEGTAGAIAVQPDQKLVVCGLDYKPNVDGPFVVARFEPDGSPDASFGINGFVRTNLNTIDFNPSGMALQADGKILIGGISSEYPAVVARFGDDGSLDASFGTGGIVASNISGDLTAITLSPDGNILFSAYSPSSSNRDFVLVRLLPAGKLDTTFGTGGSLNIDFGTSFDDPLSLAIQNDKKIVVAGTANGSLAVARVIGGAGVATFNAADKIANASVYPNPVCDGSVLKIELKEADRLSIGIYDAVGSLVHSLAGEKWYSSGIYQIAIPVNVLPKGGYVIGITGTRQYAPLKMTKLY